MELKTEKLEEYLSTLYRARVQILQAAPLTAEGVDIKGFGYGIPYVIMLSVNNEMKRVVLETLRQDGFGHDFFSDRASILLWQHSTFNRLPRHVRSLDVGAFVGDGDALKSLGDCGECFLLTEFVDGTLYHSDLDQIKQSGVMTQLDEERCLALSDYLVDIHAMKSNAPKLYMRRLRDLVGHGEGIFGLADSYPSQHYDEAKPLIEIEKSCVEWRWRLKAKTQRLSQIHGDFHPWNVIFRKGLDFTVLDRSRGEWGEPADDVAAMTINYIFYSLQTIGRMEEPFERLFLLFWRNYLDKSEDEEILEIVQPFYAWRSLVLASPVWYPNLSVELRRKIFRFATKILKTKKFDIENVDSYL